MPEPRDIEGQWLEYHLRVIPSNASRTQVRETRRAFYAGAEAMFTLVRLFSEGTKEEGAAELDRISDELVEFCKQIAKGRA